MALLNSPFLEQMDNFLKNNTLCAGEVEIIYRVFGVLKRYPDFNKFWDNLDDYYKKDILEELVHMNMSILCAPKNSGSRVTFKKVSDLIKNNENCPLPLEVIPNKMGINLCNVDSISWLQQKDGQLINLAICFIPKEEKDNDKN